MHNLGLTLHDQGKLEDAAETLAEAIRLKPDFASACGDLGLVPLSAVRQADPALRNAVLQMTPGNARVVNQGGAAAIVYLVSKEAAGQRDLTTPGVKEQITETLKARRQQLLRSAYLTSQGQSTRAGERFYGIAGCAGATERQPGAAPCVLTYTA